MALTKQELLWREWILGEGNFKGDARDPARRAETGADAKIKDAWWKRLEAFLAKRSDYSEPGRKPEGETPPIVKVPGQLSAHFNVREFACKDGRQVPPIAVPALKRLVVAYIEPMRAAFGPAHVLSGYRPRDYNARIGGAKYSQHIYEDSPSSVAADLVFRMGSPKEWAAFADHLGAGGVGRYDSSGFCHIDNRTNRARWAG